jgi:enoyl-CoA hydratase/carnithine racemase
MENAVETGSDQSAENAAELLLAETAGNGVTILTMNNPSSRNALSAAMLDALQHALDRAAADGQTRVIVLGGVGPAFCAGHDLRELRAARADSDRGRNYFTKIMRQCAKLMQSIVNHPRPVIADVRGVATAAGCQLVASCDIAIASRAARFATPGVNIGLFCSTPMVALSRKVGHNQAMEMLLTGDLISADEAMRIGLVNRAVDAEQIDRAVADLACRIAEKSLMTVRTGKQAFYRQVDMSLAEAYAYTADVMIENMVKHDAEEGVDAFLEKRKPQWRDE